MEEFTILNMIYEKIMKLTHKSKTCIYSKDKQEALLKYYYNLYYEKLDKPTNTQYLDIITSIKVTKWKKS